MGLRNMDSDEKRKIANVIRFQDQKMISEHAYEMNKRNHCMKCFMLKTKLGKCSMGCDE